MFINSKKCFEINEGDKKLVIPRGFIGNIPDWAAGHWLIQAAIRDGSIATPERALESADTEAEEKAKDFDIRPEEKTEKKPEEKPGKREKA